MQLVTWDQIIWPLLLLHWNTLLLLPFLHTNIASHREGLNVKNWHWESCGCNFLWKAFQRFYKFHQGFYLSRISDILHMWGFSGGREGERKRGPPRSAGSIWRAAAADNSKYGTSHISDVPLDLVNNSISGLTSENSNFCLVTNLRISAPPARHLVVQLHL